MTRALLPLAALWMFSCIPTPDPMPEADMGPSRDTQGPVYDDWEASTWRGQATLPASSQAPEGEHQALLSLGDDGTGLLVVTLTQGGSLGYPVTVDESGGLKLGELSCSQALSSDCATLEASLAQPRIVASLKEQRLSLVAETLRLELERDDWRNAPHDGFRPQTEGWPPCLEINPFEFMAYGDWDGRILTLPGQEWSRDPVTGAHCSWSHTDRGPSNLRCSPAALFDDFEDPKAFALSTVGVTFVEETGSMSATFERDGVSWELSGHVTNEIQGDPAHGYQTRKYRWRGVIRRDGQDAGTYTMHSWGLSDTWTPEALGSCTPE